MDNIKNLRKCENKTQTELASMLGISQSSYQSYESGLTEPNIENLKKLADFYNVSIDYLVGRPFANEFGHMSTAEKSLIIAFRQLNEVNQIKVVSFISGILAVQE